jgi:pyruvate/2-oxoglutarate dehydrogenase complex dihydrolipoamide acyltransferase (E2) component
MPQIPIIMPQLGESIAEAAIVNFLVKPGDPVRADQDVIEVETNKANMTVTAPCNGRLEKFRVELNESYPVGAVLGLIEATAEEAARLGLDSPHPTKPVAEFGAARGTTATHTADGERHRVQPTVRGLPVPAHAAGASYMSPRMKARMDELGLHASDLSGIAGSGAGGRVTIQDFEKFIANLEAQKLTPASTMRVAVADAMRRSWTRPLATVGVAVNLDPILQDRQSRDPKPGPALYALRALAVALAEQPNAAARLIGGRAIGSQSIDIGLAVEAGEGIMVPVIRKADKTSLAELTKKYAELVDLARRRRLTSEMTSGGIASVSNFGTFGLDWGTPIPLPDQTMIVGLGVGKKTPAWDESKKEFVPKTEAQVTLSFDHRSLDGGGAGRLLKRVIELLEDPKKL